MIRSFDPRAIAPELVERILENAQRGPSAGFSQGFGFLALESAEDRALFWTETRLEVDNPMRHAPLIVVALSNKDVYLDRYAREDKGWTDRDESRWPVPYWDIDAGMASLLMLQTAVDVGLDACFIGIPPAEIPGFRSSFGVPPELNPIGAVIIGYRASDAGAQPGSWRNGRRSTQDMVRHSRWSA